jgi:hypothetical protein
VAADGPHAQQQQQQQVAGLSQRLLARLLSRPLEDARAGLHVFRAHAQAPLCGGVAGAPLQGRDLFTPDADNGYEEPAATATAAALILRAAEQLQRARAGESLDSASGLSATAQVDAALRHLRAAAGCGARTRSVAPQPVAVVLAEEVAVGGAVGFAAGYAAALAADAARGELFGCAPR